MINSFFLLFIPLSLMENSGKFLYLQNSKLHYKVLGSGSNVLIAFHGYGQDMRSLYGIEQVFINHRIYLFDLFFHGQSTWQENNKAITPERWTDLFNVFLKTEKINTFSLLGFSIGAKLALSLVSKFENKIENVILIAPDGIKPNFWYKLATGSVLGRLLFQNFSSHPKRYIKVFEFLSNLRLVDKGLKRFVLTQVKSERQRKLVLDTWLVFRKLVIDKKRLVAQINHSGIFVCLFVGKYDKVIPPNSFDNFVAGLSKIKYVKLDTGHFDLVPSVIDYFKTENFKIENEK